VREKSQTCHVRWSDDGRIVAGVRDRSIERVAVDATRERSFVEAPPGVRFLDGSLSSHVLLESRNGHQELVGMDGHSPVASGAWQTLTAPYYLSDDGTALLHAPAHPYPEDATLDDTEFLDLKLGTLVKVDVPYFAAGGSDQGPFAMRRGAIAVGQSRILMGVYPYRRPHNADGSNAGFAITSCFAQEGQGEALLFGFDVDASFATAVVARIACEAPPPRRPIVEVYDARQSPPRVVHSWNADGKPVGLDLSADGSRLLSSVERHGQIVRELWDTRRGTELREVRLSADCFELAPDGSSVAAIVEGRVQLQDLR
jgi:hypothetical protein